MKRDLRQPCAVMLSGTLLQALPCCASQTAARAAQLPAWCLRPLSSSCQSLEWWALNETDCLTGHSSRHRSIAAGRCVSATYTMRSIWFPPTQSKFSCAYCKCTRCTSTGLYVLILHVTASGGRPAWHHAVQDEGALTDMRWLSCWNLGRSRSARLLILSSRNASPVAAARSISATNMCAKAA